MQGDLPDTHSFFGRYIIVADPYSCYSARIVSSILRCAILIVTRERYNMKVIVQLWQATASCTRVSRAV